jgi:hypothetical protein
MRIGDFRPISLVHSIAKKISKILAKRLAPKLSEMVSSSQSAFVKRSCIQDNVLQVQGLLKEFHRKKVNTLFIKLDIAKAFDSVSWAYLLELMERIGFGPKWRNWMSIALSTASSRVLLNGILGKPIKARKRSKTRRPHLAYVVYPRHGPTSMDASLSNRARSFTSHLCPC